MNRRNFLQSSCVLSLGVMGKKAIALAPYRESQALDFKNSFVTISKKNPFYFELTNSESFIVNGPCLAGAADMATMESYLKKLSANGGNFARVWLCNRLFEVEKTFGVYDEEQAKKIDALLAWAVQYNIRLKLCLDNTRQIVADKTASFNRPQYHVANGGPFNNVDEYINTDAGRKAYLNRVEFFSRRYQNHPAVFGWELWNEMNGIMCKGLWEWNEYMLPRVHQLFPENLVLQSLGSFDMESRRNDYRHINQLAANDVAQIHRYIDEGAKLDVCTAPMDILSSDAIDELRSYHIKKPLLLAEAGAVKPSHTGPSELYPSDKEGALLHDMLFAPFFSGAAGTGNAWHWDAYIDKNNLWYHYGRFAKAVHGINPVEERFVPLKLYHDRLRVYVLAGHKTTLAWCRDIKNDWKTELKDGIAAEETAGQRIDITGLVSSSIVKSVKFYNPWLDQWTVSNQLTDLQLPAFKRSLIVKIEKH